MSVFGRNGSGGTHPYESELLNWRATGDAGRQALACNVAHDHRVSQEREDEFESARAGNFSLWDAISSYHMHSVRFSKGPPAFLNPSNAHNRCDALQAAANEKLVSILDVTGLGKLFQQAFVDGIPGFESFPLAGGADKDLGDINSWLDDRLVQHSPGNAANLDFALEKLLPLVNNSPKNPIWVGLWSEFEQYYEAGPERWLEVFGLPKETARWLILLRYEFNHVRSIFRPTTLDAGMFPYHFPSPPTQKWPVEHGGIAVDVIGNATSSLQVSPTPILKEFIHEHVTWDRSHIFDIRKTLGAVDPCVVNSRTNHHNLLQRTFGQAEIIRWMLHPI